MVVGPKSLWSHNDQAALLKFSSQDMNLAPYCSRCDSGEGLATPGAGRNNNKDGGHDRSSRGLPVLGTAAQVSGGASVT